MMSTLMGPSPPLLCIGCWEDECSNKSLANEVWGRLPYKYTTPKFTVLTMVKVQVTFNAHVGNHGDVHECIITACQDDP